MRAAGVRVELLVGKGMWHGFTWESMPDAIQMRGVVREFLNSC